MSQPPVTASTWTASLLSSDLGVWEDRDEFGTSSPGEGHAGVGRSLLFIDSTMGPYREEVGVGLSSSGVIGSRVGPGPAIVAIPDSPTDQSIYFPR